ncbi:MAG: hypothetical protein ABIN95_05740, partial [Mucilaginibacter sp.]
NPIIMFAKRLVLLFFIATALAACDKESNSNCPDKLCTAEFAAVTIKFVDKDGEGVWVKNYSAVNQRTKDTINYPPAAHLLLDTGAYIVASDNNTKTLSEAGDDIKISGTDSVSNITLTAIVKVSGGECACHITKVAGPSEIKFIDR